MVNVEIDGVVVKARDGALIIEAADEAGIPIPRFCYHKKLSIAANCRMCLVEVEKAGKPMPACATPVTEGMKVFTRSARALDAQKGTMEFLLINHPLDCPICDQGGECDLQEMAMGYGADSSRFAEGKRVVRDKNLGPLIATDMTRCIHCTRCVRFGEEVAGVKELGATGRGEHMEIGTYVQHAVASELSGNVIDLCPVGALTSKPFRYSARPWELISRPGVAPHDCVGSNIHYHVRQVRGAEVMRVLPRENEALNETWISDRDRYAYTALHSGERLLKPRVKRDGQWQEVDWETALGAAVNGLKAAMYQGGAAEFGTLVSASATVEEHYLAQKLTRALGSPNVDHRLRQQDVSDQAAAPLYPHLGMSIEALESLDAVLLVGANVRKDQPIIGHRLRKAVLKGAELLCVNPVDYEMRARVAARIVATPAGMERALAGIVKALAAQTNGRLAPEWESLLGSATVDDVHQDIARRLRQGSRRAVLLGSEADAMPNRARLRALAAQIAQLAGAVCGELSAGANAAGAWLAGAVPHRGPVGVETIAGVSAHEMLDKALKGYLLLGVEPEFDAADSGAALRALDAAFCVVAITTFTGTGLERYAHVLLPAAAYAETAGTFVNAEGHWQSFAGALAPRGEARPAWKILRVLGNLLGLAGFDYMSAEEVREELRARAKDVALGAVTAPAAPAGLADVGEGLVVRLADPAMYAVDGHVRRAAPLQETPDAAASRSVSLHPETAARLGLADAARVRVRQGAAETVLALALDARVAPGAAWIAAGTAEVVGLGAYGAVVELTRA